MRQVFPENAPSVSGTWSFSSLICRPSTDLDSGEGGRRRRSCRLRDFPHLLLQYAPRQVFPGLGRFSSLLSRPSAGLDRGEGGRRRRSSRDRYTQQHAHFDLVCNRARANGTRDSTRSVSRSCLAQLAARASTRRPSRSRRAPGGCRKTSSSRWCHARGAVSHRLAQASYGARSRQRSSGS